MKVAQAHLLAATAPAGERYAILEGTFKLIEIGKALSAEFKKHGYKVADKEMSYCLAKMLSCCVKDVSRFTSIWNKRRPIRNNKSISKFGMKSYKPLKDTCTEMGWSLIKLGIIEDKTK